MHDNFNRCGGFIFHESEQEAVNYLTNSPNGITQPLSVTYTIDNPDGVNSLLGALSSTQLNDTVNTLSAYHNRYYSQQSRVDSANWIKSNWQDISQTRSDISVELFIP